MLTKKIEEARARGEAPPDEPGVEQILADMKNAKNISELATNEYHVSKAEEIKQK